MRENLLRVLAIHHGGDNSLYLQASGSNSYAGFWAPLKNRPRYRHIPGLRYTCSRPFSSFVVTRRVMGNSYDVLSTTTWFSSLARRRNCTVSGSRRSRPSRMILRHNGAQEARARRGVPLRSEPLPPSTVVRLDTGRRTAQRETDGWIPDGGFPSVFMTPPPIRSWGSPRRPTCSLTSGK